jgi:shikimate kinase
MASLSKPIVLIGLMGAGKSTVGLRLAEALGVEFKDSDHEIEEAAGCTISDLFAIYGEDIFRDLEKRVLKRLLKERNLVLATGGGSYIQPALQEEIKNKAFTVWLRADVDTLVERVSRRDTRPLLATGDKRKILTRLIKERYPVYQDADLVVDSNNGSHERIVREIVQKLKQQTGLIINHE